MKKRRVLSVATVSQSLVLQSPASWEVLQERGHELVFAAARDEWTSRLAEWGSYVELPASRSALSADHLGFRRELRHLLRADTWDLVQLQTPIAAVLARTIRELSLAHRVLYVAHGFHFHHDAGTVRNEVVRRLERALARRCDAIAVVSEEDYEEATRVGFGERALIWQLPGAGVDVAGFASSQALLPFGRPHAIYCGDMISRKNPLLAIHAMAVVHERGGERLPLVLIGSGPLVDEVVREAEIRLGAENYLHLPWTDNVGGYMAGASVHLLPSWQEGVPRVVMEAMAARVCTVATSNRGTRELHRRGAGLLLARNATAHDWADAIVEGAGQRLSEDVAMELSRYDVDSFKSSYNDLLSRLGM